MCMLLEKCLNSSVSGFTGEVNWISPFKRSAYSVLSEEGNKFSEM